MAETVSFFIKISDNGTFKKVEVDADSLKDAVKTVKAEVDELNAGLINMAQVGLVVDMIQQGFDQLTGVVDELTGAYAQQEIAEQKLANNMRNMMDATDAEIQSIKDLCAAQQALGVIGDEVQLAGAQELATYLEKKSSLEALIPVMNDMLAQQYGLEASQESAAQVASMLGKVMDGQVGALSRYGYKFDEIQEHILKFGTEEERAAVLAEVVESAVGGMNAELAKTESGKQKQLANTLGDIKEKVGEMAQSIAPLTTVASGVVNIASAAVRCSTSVKAMAAAMNVAAVKSTLLAAHERIQSIAQTLLAATTGSATASTWALNTAVTALYATLTAGLYLAVEAIIMLFVSLGDEAEDAAEDVDILKSSTDAFTNATSDVKAEIDVEIASLKGLIDAHSDTSKEVDKLNQKYGEALGYHKTAAEWYDTLVTKSKAYCMQLGYEAQAKVLASQIAAKELEKESQMNRLSLLEQHSMDGEGKIHFAYEKINGGKEEYEALRGSVTSLLSDLDQLNAQYGTCIERMLSARLELERTANAAQLGGKEVEINKMTYTELSTALEENQKALSELAPNETAEIGRLKGINQQLEERKKKLGQLLGLEKATTPSGKTTTPKKDEPVADPKTYVEVSDAIRIYEKRLNETDVAERETVKSLTSTIQKLKEKQWEVEKSLHDARRPEELNTLESIDAEIRYQQQLKSRSTNENIQNIEQEISRLNSLKTTLEDQSHVVLKIEEIKTYRQLDDEISYYERKLQHSTESERIEVEKQLVSLRKLREEWDDTLSALDMPADISKLDTIEKLDNAVSYYSTRQKKASGDEIEQIQRTIDALDAKRSALLRLTELPSMQRELDTLGSAGDQQLKIELELVGLDGVRNKIRSLQKMLDDTKNPLGKQQQQEVRGMIEQWKAYEVVLAKGQVDFRKVWSGAKNVGVGVERITDALKDNQNAWETVTGLVDGTLSVYDGLKAVIDIINLLTLGSEAHAAAKAVESGMEVEEASTMVGSAAAEQAASAATSALLGIEAAEWSALAAAKTFAAHAYIPFAGTGIASGFVSTQQAIIAAAAIPKFAEGAVAYGPTLGIFGEYAGAQYNPEVVAPLSKLKGLIADVGGAHGKVEFRIRYRDLVGVLEKGNKLISRG